MFFLLTKNWLMALCGLVKYLVALIDSQVEIKNLNSFSSVSRAIDFEISRQVLLHSQGQSDQIVQETRLWEEGAQVFLRFMYAIHLSSGITYDGSFYSCPLMCSPVYY